MNTNIDNSCRMISNEQLDRLYEIQRFLLQIENFTGGDSVSKRVLELCDSLLDELDPSSELNYNLRYNKESK